MRFDDDANISAVQPSRRAVLARNGRAIALIAAAAVAGKSSSALANCGGGTTGVGNGCCFLRGTAIRTVDGWRAVEDLKIGDMAPTRFSGVQPIRWVGRYTIAGNWAAGRKAAVRISASAIAPGVPRADLVVTAGHSLLIAGLLFPAESLINGKTITAVDAPAGGALEFFHVKLDRHDVIDAEGAPSETMGAMRKDDPNFEAYAKLYGAEEEMIPACAPIAFNGPRSELASRLRSAAAPWIDRRRPADVIRDDLEARAWDLTQAA